MRDITDSDQLMQMEFKGSLFNLYVNFNQLLGFNRQPFLVVTLCPGATNEPRQRGMSKEKPGKGCETVRGREEIKGQNKKEENENEKR